LRARGVDLQAHVARIKFGQHLSALDARTDIYEPAHQMPADLERQRRFLARADITGKRHGGKVQWPWMHDQRRPWRIGICLAMAASGQQQGCCERYGQDDRWNGTKSGSAHGAIPVDRLRQPTGAEGRGRRDGLIAEL
jgi:hypothetical protein